MTDDKDLKRLIRQRMAKTGESYTTARAHYRPRAAVSSTSAGVEAFRKRLYTRSGLDRLGEHLERRYGIRVRGLAELDLGVFRVDRADGPTWVARVFPAVRSGRSVAEDAALLATLESADYPAERCANDDPVSVLDGQGVLVTRYIAGLNGRFDSTGATLFALGESLGRLHTMPIPEGADRRAGAWHHLSVDGGGLGDDVEVLLALMSDAEARVSPGERATFDSVRERLRVVDTCDDLPGALIHPSPSGANAIVTPDGAPVLVDWAGAGCGPRVLSLAALVEGTLHTHRATARSRDLRRIDAVVAGYRRHATPGDAELARFAAAMAGPAVVLECWSFLFQDVPLSEVARFLGALGSFCDAAAERVAEAFDRDVDALTAWFRDVPMPVHPGQGTLF